MERIILLILSAMLLLKGNAQVVVDSVCTNFESLNNFISISGGPNSWQMGVPNKTVFNSSHSPTSSIATDSVNPYPVNDTSVFIAVYGPPVASYLDTYFPFQIDFYHRFNTDTLTDNGRIEISFDGGSSWINGLNDEYMGFFPYSTTHYFENDGSTYADSLNVSGNSNGWVHSIIAKNVDAWAWGTGNLDIDSIMVKFTFISDNVDNSKDGWQIDDLCLKYYYQLMSIDGNEPAILLNIFPNPFAFKTTIRTNFELNDACLAIYNQYGQPVKSVEHISGQSISLLRDNLRSGLYYVRLSQRNKILSTKKLFVID